MYLSIRKIRVGLCYYLELGFSGLLLLTMLLLFPLSSYAGDGIYWLKITQGNAYTARNASASSMVLELMQDNRAVKAEELKLMEAGWWCQTFGPRNAPPPPRVYRKLPLGTRLEIAPPVTCRAVILLRFEKDNKVYTVQQNTYLRGLGGEEKAFLAFAGDPEPKGPRFSDPRTRMANNGNINGVYEALTPGVKVVRGYDEELVQENQVNTNEKNLFSYKPNDIERFSLDADNRIYVRHFVVEEKLQDKAYISTLSTIGMRNRRRFQNRNHGVLLAIVSGVVFGAGCIYLIRRRSKHVNS